MKTARKILGCSTGVVILTLLTGCATQLARTDVDDSGKPAALALSVQNIALTPDNGGQLVQADALRPGDIILTAANGVASVGFRLLTLAPVSHAAIYIGDNQVAEAVGEGVRIRTIAAILKEEAVVVAFRHPGFTGAHAVKLREFSAMHVGGRYNHIGVLLHAPFSIERRVCELPLVPEAVRDFCVRGVGSVQLGASRNDRFFCSQFVLEAYRHAGLPMTDADPRLISPADILHMREGDVSSVKIHRPLVYIGHLKYQMLLARSR